MLKRVYAVSLLVVASTVFLLGQIDWTKQIKNVPTYVSNALADPGANGFVKRTAANTSTVAGSTDVWPGTIPYSSVTSAPGWVAGSTITTGNSVAIGASGSPSGSFYVFGTSGNPSLSSDATDISNIEASPSQQLVTGGLTNGPYSMWLQVKGQSNGGASFPLSLNPLGGNVGVGVAGSNPATPFQVYGTGNLPSAVAGQNTGIVTITGNAGPVDLEIGEYPSGTYVGGVWLQSRRQSDGTTWPFVINPLGGVVDIPAIKATTGTRYVCVDTNGALVCSATACSGT